MRKTPKILLGIFLLLMTVGALFFTLFDYKGEAKQWVIAEAQKHGVTLTDFTIVSYSLHHVTLKDISITAPVKSNITEASFNRLTHVLTLKAVHLPEVKLQGKPLTFDTTATLAYEDKEKPYSAKGTATGAPGNIRFDYALHLPRGGTGAAQVTLKDITMAAPMKLNIGKASFDGTTNVLAVKTIHLPEVKLQGQPLTFDTTAKLAYQDKEKPYLAVGSAKGGPGEIRFDYVLQAPRSGTGDVQVTLKDGKVNFAGGTVHTWPVTFTPAKMKRMVIPLQAEKLSLHEILKLALTEKAAATGTVSGEVPLIITPDTPVNIGKGRLTADGPGVIQLPPGTIPASGEQMQLLASALENFHYETLSVFVEPGASETPEVSLKMEGKNPIVLEGRTFKLSVNLSGDVLSFLTTTLTLMQNPQELLHAK